MSGVFGSGPVSRIREGGATPLSIVLVLTVSLSLWLGYEAYHAARDHRAAVESTLRDYTAMAAWELSRLSEESLHWFLDEVFDDYRRSRRYDFPAPGGMAREMAQALDWHDCACPDLREPILEFRVDFPSGTITLAPDTFPRDVAGRLAAVVDERVAVPEAPGRGFIVVPAGSVLEQGAAVGYWVVQRRGDPGFEAHGFAVPLAGVGQLVEHWYQNNPLLPPSAARMESNDSLLHARVATADGTPVFASTGDFREGLASRDTLSGQWGGLQVEVNVRSGGAERLVAGGLPPARTPLFIGMILLVVAMGITGLVQIRREQELARLRDDFVSGVSHELRTPLAQIRMFAELQGAGKLRTEEDRRRAVSVIDREARRLTHLVENVLQFTRLRRAPTPHSPAGGIELTQALEEAVEGFRPLLEEKGMTVRWESEPGLRAQVSGGTLRHILVNLLDNAAKYGPAGQEVSVTADSLDGWARIVVEDQGPGVPRSDRERIWAPYRRLDRDVRGPQPGTGVGLAVVSALARQHGGSARVEDARGGGARFVVELPALRAFAPDDSAGGAEAPEAATEVPA